MHVSGIVLIKGYGVGLTILPFSRLGVYRSLVISGDFCGDVLQRFRSVRRSFEWLVWETIHLDKRKRDWKSSSYGTERWRHEGWTSHQNKQIHTGLG